MMDIPQATFLKRRVELNYVLFLTSIYLREGLPLLLDYLPGVLHASKTLGKKMSWISHRLNIVTLFYFAMKYLLTLKVRH